jgi:hypothetical protein
METLLFEGLRGLVGNRVYPDVGPDKCGLPYMTYQQVGGDALNFQDGALPDKSNARVQVNVWAVSRIEAKALAKAAENALRGVAALRTTVLGAPVSNFDQAAKLYGTRQDFSFWTSD